MSFNRECGDAIKLIDELKASVEIYEGLSSSLKCPRRYVAFVRTFANIVKQKTAGISEQQQRLQVKYKNIN